MTKQDAWVYIVDDDDDFRESLAWLLDSDGYRCQGFNSAEAFLEAYQDEPGCLLLDVRMHGMSGLELQRHLREHQSMLPVILITGHGDVAMAVEAMKNQAVDFISKPFDDTQLLALLERVMAQLPARHRQWREQTQAQADWQQLSQREQQVANLVVTGLSNKGIAEKLSISIKTVEIHRSRVMKKMQADNLAQLIQAYNYLAAKGDSFFPPYSVQD